MSEELDVSKYGIKEVIDFTDEFQQLKQENEEIKIHYEQQLKSMVNNFNEQKQKYDNEYMEYSKELGRLRQKLEKIRQLHQWILDQWVLETKEVQDKVLQIIESESND